jgi:hypothetical protein
MHTILSDTRSTRRRARLLSVATVAFIVASCGGPGDPTGSLRSASADPAVAVASAPARTLAPTPTVTPSPSLPTSAPSATPTPVATPEPPREAFAYNLFRRGDYVAQYTLEWCVGASLQMALNMTTDTNDTSRRRQQALWTMAQERSDSPFGGANPIGWTAALNDLGIGPYELVSVPDLESALQVAATALRQTKRPVGLVMWRGRHAWVMSGFESVGDPRLHDSITVTGVRVLDPLYPNDSSRWGASPKPNALLTPAVLGKQFVRREGGRVDLGVPPGYLLILPTTGEPANPAD